MSDCYLFPKENRIVVNPKGRRSAEKILLHELDHAVRKGIRKDGGTALFAEAISGIDEKSLEKIASTYENVESDVTQLELMFDEANAYFAETVFANKNVLESITEKMPSLKERILSFFDGAQEDYKGVPKFEGAAKRYYKLYKKMFDEFAARNEGNNAEGGSAEGARYAIELNSEEQADLELLFDKEFYSAYENEDRTKITESIEELEQLKASKKFSSLSEDEQFDINAKIRALEAGYF